MTIRIGAHMKILIIRHGDPDYSIDSLTEKGWREAELLSERICKLDVKNFYVSPLGRAKDTASLILKKLNREAEVKEWLREFQPKIEKPHIDGMRCAWDWLPADWTEQKYFYEKDSWADVELMKNARVQEEYDWVTTEFDALLEEHGYKREKQYYRVEKGNMDTIVFFCHFGLECVLLSHLLGVSPMVLWHGMCAAPTSVTTLVTEERRKGIASFRMSSFGDISHLYVAGEEPAFAARFCECYENMDERHD